MRVGRRFPTLCFVLALVMMAVAVLSCKNAATTRPVADTAASAAAEEEAARFAQEQRFPVVRDETLPGKPVVALECYEFWGALSHGKPDDIPRAMEVVRKLKHLKRINDGCSGATDACLKGLSDLPNLEELNLWGINNFTEAGLKEIGKIKSLKKLNLGGQHYQESNKITNRGVAHLTDLKNLEELVLSKNKITDAGLKKLRGMQNLKHLDLTGNPVTDKGIEELKKALPKTEILGP